MKANNVTRLLDANKIAYTALELPAEKLGAMEAAQILSVPANQVFKTIVVKREGKGKLLLAVVPGDSEVDLKALAKAVSEKKLSLPTQREAEQMTGLQAGGISPLALIHRGFQTIIDETANRYEKIYISGGQRGLDIHIAVKDLIKLVNAQVAAIGSPPVNG
jgi:Cys-tRNA(Pro)/Cys-tRNA(Cys) deacylase